MTGTAFTALHPRQLIDEEANTPFLDFRPKRIGQGLRQKLDAVTAYLDRALAEPASGMTPLLEGTPELTAAGPGIEGDDVLRDRALVAIKEICSALAISETKTASLIGVARNTLASWRRKERAPYPATVQKLFEVHSIVSAATALFGVDGARQWFHGYTDEGRSRADVLRASGGTQVLAGELRAALFPGAGPSALPAPDELDDLDEDTVAEQPAAYAPGAFAGRVVRARKVP